MGLGDELIATGIARGAKARHRRIAFGDGRQIFWSQQSHEIFRGNPNIAPPGSEPSYDLEWVPYYKGHRFYGTAKMGRWAFNKYDCPAGEIFFTDEEVAFGRKHSAAIGQPFVILEPNTKPMGACVGANKQWQVEKYQIVATRLMQRGIACVQFVGANNPRSKLEDVQYIHTPTFRDALAILEHAHLYIGPEGGLHHGCAAVRTMAIVIFGGFNSPRSTGYPWHHNIAVGEPCGRISKCDHCARIMQSITVDQVLEPALRLMERQSRAMVS